MVNKSILLIFVFLFLISSILATDIGYIIKEDFSPDPNILSSIESLWYNYEIIHQENIDETNFDDYNMIIIGNQNFHNSAFEIPINNKNSLFLASAHLDDWHWADSVTQMGGSNPLSANNLDLENGISFNIEKNFKIYTACCEGGNSLPVYSLDDKVRSLGLKGIISTVYDDEDLIIATADKGSELIGGYVSNSRGLFFGITETNYWTSESQELFLNSIEWVMYGGDEDHDDVKADFDNCIYDYNPDQIDSDDDGLGDSCDACIFDEDNDIDNDGVCGDVDNCILIHNSGQEDFDEDFFGDGCDDDVDDDGIDNINDLCVFTQLTKTVNENGCADYQLIVINEFESNPKGDDSGNEWIELYNPTDSDVDISNWKIKNGLSSPSLKHTVPDGTVLDANSYYVAEDVSSLTNTNEFLTLHDIYDNEIDKTPTLSDSGNDVKTWQRKPNGIDTDDISDWDFQINTKNMNNDADVDTPVLNDIGDKQVNENSLLSFIVSAIDYGDELITLSAIGLPSGASFDTIQLAGYVEQVFSWTPTYEQEGDYEVEFVVSDGILNDLETITINVDNTNRAPVLGLITNQLMNEDCEPIEMVLSSSDEDGDELTYSVINENEDEVDCEIDGDEIKITNAKDWSGDATCTIQVSDGDLTDEQLFNIHVEPVNDAPKIKSFSPLEPVILLENTDEIFNVVVNDVDEDDLTITWFLDDIEVGTGSNYVFNQPKESYEVKVIVSDGLLEDEQVWDVFVGDISDFKCSQVNGYIIPDNKECLGKLLGTSDSNELTCCSIAGSPKFGDVDRCEFFDERLKIIIKDPDDGDEFTIGETIDVEIEIENKFDDDFDFDIEAYLYDITDDNEILDYEDDIDVDKDEDEKMEFSFEIEEDLDEGNEYAIFVRAIEEDDELFCNEEYILIDIEREEHDVTIEDVLMNEQVICGDYFYVETKLKNLGTKDEDVYLLMENNELGIIEQTQEFELEKYDDKDKITKNFEIKIPENVEEGLYDIKFTSFFDDGDEDYSLSKSLYVECKQIETYVKTVGETSLQGQEQEVQTQTKDNKNLFLILGIIMLVLIIIIFLLKLMYI